MTARGQTTSGPPRPPKRTLSNSSALSSQRPPPHQRALAQQKQQQQIQQYSPSPPSRRDVSLLDTPDAADTAPSRYGGTPRRGGSRLKLELSHENSNVTQISSTGSPMALTPSRIAPMNEPPDPAPASPNATPSMAKPPPPLENAGLEEADGSEIIMPQRRRRFERRPALPVRVPAAASSASHRRDARPKLYAPEVPLDAPRYRQPPKPDTNAQLPRVTNSGFADFYPWTGHHLEDRFSDHVIRAGLFDKVQFAQGELGSAKQTLLPTLKQKSCLNNLSTIFVAVMSQRRQTGQITSKSTFKPPPRVTLTDTKREMWLKDLSNPAISLRRLSRTIPHGIRGKVLLEHCLNKNIPTERAVWLARCVGANEIRAFKRKGIGGSFVMGGETKWIRDWTAVIEMFVESVFSTFDDPNWKAKATYVLRLAASLYAEQLLDPDHYFDWLLSGLENSSEAKLPMWILIAKIYWNDLFRLRKTGRRLVIALLKHVHTIQSDPDKDILAPLLSSIIVLVSASMTNHSESFIYPAAWRRYRDTIFEALSANDERSHNAYKMINSRNEWLAGSARPAKPSGSRTLIETLDKTFTTSFHEGLATHCWSLGGDKHQLLRSVLDWSTSPYRPGFVKVYVAIGLLQEWTKHRIDVTQSVLEFLDASSTTLDRPHKPLVYHLVSELVRLGCFSVARYLQWLIARGNLVEPSEAEPDGPCASRLLAELPVHALEPALQITRANLLRRASFDVESEAIDTANALALVDKVLCLPGAKEEEPLLSLPKSMTARKLAKPISRSSRSLQTRIGSHIRQLVDLGKPGENAFEMTALRLDSIGILLEAARDFSTLAYVLDIAIKTQSVEVLASCAETMHLHLSIFAALGVSKSLFHSLLEALKSAGATPGLAFRRLLASMAFLAEQIPGLEVKAQQIRSELRACERSGALDPCSPISENMVGQTDYESRLHEEIEKLLTSGTSIDRLTMDKYFLAIIRRLEASWAKSCETQRAYSSLLATLRIFDARHFDARMTDWLRQLKTSTQMPPINEAFPLLVSLGCVQLRTIVQASISDTSTGPAGSSGATTRGGVAWMQEVLRLVISPLPYRTSLSDDECCRFHIQQNDLRSPGYSAELLALLRQAINEFCQDGPGSEMNVGMFDTDEGWTRILEFVKWLALVDTSAVSRALSSKPGSKTFTLIERLSTALIAPGVVGESHVSFDQILGSSNDLSLPFCQLKLSLILANEDTVTSYGSDASENPPSQLSLFVTAMDKAISAGNVLWTSVLPHLNDNIAQYVRTQAQSRFLSLIPSPRSGFQASAAVGPPVHMAQNLFFVVESITRGPLSRPTQILPGLVEKMTDLAEIVWSRDNERKVLKSAVLKDWLPLMLRFLALSTGTPALPETASTPVPPSNASMAPPATAASIEARVKILVTMSSLLHELSLSTVPSEEGSACLTQQVFDTALLVADGLSDDARAKCSRLLLAQSTPSVPASVSSDRRLQYLFSYMPPTEEGLMLSRRDRTSKQPNIPRSRASGPGINARSKATERLTPFILRRWEMLNEPTPNVGENDTALSLKLFEAIKIQ